MKSRRFGALAAALLFAATCAVWLNYVPYTPGRLLVAVPAEATWVSTHYELAGRWDELAANPLVRALATDTGMALDDDPVVALLRPALRRETVVAYVPQVGSLRKPAWFVVSWVGARSFRTRWWLNFRPPETIETHPIHRGRSYWTVKDRPIAFALEEGMLIACVTEDPPSILASLICFDGSAPSAAETDQGRKDWLVGEGTPDRGWHRPWSSASGQATRYELTRADRNRLTLRAHLASAVAPSGAVPELTSLQSLFGELPAALVQARPDAVYSLVQPWSSTGWGSELATVFRDAGGDRLVLAMFGGEYSGRLRGARVPALVAASPVPDEGQALRAAASALHRLNERYGWGLSLKDGPGSSNVLHLVESAPGTAYAEQPTEEKIAFGVADGYLLVASNYDTLQRLIARQQWASAAAEHGSQGMWGSIQRSSPMSGTFDLDRSGKAVRNGLAVYSMTRMMSGQPGAGAAQARTDTIKSAVIGLQALGAAECRLEQGPDGAILTVELGRDE